MGAIFKFLLFCSIPAGDIREIAGDPRDLGDIMGSALRADRGTTERTIFKRFNNIMRAVTVIDRAHQLELRLAAGRTRLLIHNMMAGMAFVLPLFRRDIIKAGIPLDRLLLFVSQVHAEY